MIIINNVTISPSVVTTGSKFVLSVDMEWMAVTWRHIMDDYFSWQYIVDTYKTWKQVMNS